MACTNSRNSKVIAQGTTIMLGIGCGHLALEMKINTTNLEQRPALALEKCYSSTNMSIFRLLVAELYH